MRTSLQAAVILVAFASATFAQDAADTPPEQAAIIANDRAYEAAYASGDAKALVDFFTDDADYTAEDASKVVAHYLTVLGKRLLQLPNRFRINFGRDNNHQPMAEWLEDEIYSALEEVSELPEAVRRGKVFDVDGD